MNSADIQQVASQLGAHGAPWWPLLLTAIVGGLCAFFGAYLGQKGKNVATKEDVAEITRSIEAVKADYAQKLEELKGKHQLRMACLDRRLTAHQEAFVLWRKLIANVHQKDSIHSVVREADEWWERNCLFLDSESRRAFRAAMIAANSHGLYLEGRLEPEKIKANWKEIIDAGDFIVRGADLPPISDESLRLPKE